MKRLISCLVFLSCVQFSVCFAEHDIPPSVILNLSAVSENARIRLDEPDVKVWHQEDAWNIGKGIPFRLGASRTIPVDAIMQAETILDTDYGLVRRLAILSPGALELQLHLVDVHLPPDSALYIYAEHQTFADRYTQNDVYGDRTLWSYGSPGDTLILEWHWENAPDADVTTPFKVKQISHLYRDRFDAFTREGNCHNDATCDPDYIPQRDATAYIEFNDNGTYICSGVMLNNIFENYIPYFLTANHCIYTETIANSLKGWFFFHTQNCNDPRPPRGLRTVTGATLLATGGAAGGNRTDYSLLRLNEADYTGVYFAGWDRIPLTNGTAVTGIHHPDAAYKRISYGTVSSLQYAGQWGVTWNRMENPGVTEVGSSGSALFLDSGQSVVGQLWAGSSSCQNQNGQDFYGRFGASFVHGDLGQWLGNASDCHGAYWPGSGPTPTPTATQPAGTPTPTPVPDIVLSIVMPATMFRPGDVFACAVVMDNAGTSVVSGIPLFVILDVYGTLFFAPEFNDFSYSDVNLPPGETIHVVLPAFDWPPGTGSADSIFWYAGLTDKTFSRLIGNVDVFQFGWMDEDS